ncbi:hypothetical protein H2199_009033 [Coniosporium tulheliwenetii]|uniref:Uncharacterized protein n=1 Tax=Coniosporium tulheliwenetii TaxID=3383036 RepID=A0ACC2YGL6_9PEZI|nr:hypothetical protein H2199_009033 [Cladosporium sp. JES 115]
MSEQKLRDTLKQLAAEGYFAVVVEMVRASDDRVLPPAEWETLCRCCSDVGLYIVVDEALTAVRCGAPFAHQRPEYKALSPSFVLFGKAIVACGLGVCWNGVHMNRLGYSDSGREEDVADILRSWDMKVSQALPAASLLNSWGVLILAQQEDWPQRASRVGAQLRRILRDMYPGIVINGLEALIYIARAKASTTNIIGAAAGKVVRWMPFLDQGMDDESQPLAAANAPQQTG